MKPLASPSPRGLTALCSALAGSLLLAACVVQPLPPPRYYVPPPQPVYVPPPQPAAPEPVVSVYVDPPLAQPEPIAVAWAPPPMLVEAPPPQPFPDAVWTGGYWGWEGRWIWCAGRWSPPPRPHYAWVQPYYEHRGDVVVFVPGYWSAPEARFVPPPVGVTIAVAVVTAGVVIGAHPMGPQGVFVPPPPGSRAGLIVPAPIGTPPAVVVSAPPVVNVGMRIQGNLENNSHNTTINNVTNVTNVTIVAPPGATANGQAFQNSVPARAHLAAALPPMVHAAAPMPASATPIPTYVAGRQPVALPAAQHVRNEPAGAQARPAFQEQPRPAGGQPAAAAGRAEPQALPATTAQPPQQAQQFQPAQRPMPNTPGTPAYQTAGTQPNGREQQPASVQAGQPGQAQAQAQARAQAAQANGRPQGAQQPGASAPRGKPAAEGKEQKKKNEKEKERKEHGDEHRE